MVPAGSKFFEIPLTSVSVIETIPYAYLVSPCKCCVHLHTGLISFTLHRDLQSIQLLINATPHAFLIACVTTCKGAESLEQIARNIANIGIQQHQTPLPYNLLLSECISAPVLSRGLLYHSITIHFNSCLHA